MMFDLMRNASRRHRRGKMKKVFVLILVPVLVCSLLSGCAKQKASRPITDVNNLDGHRIGVALAWGPDYLLTDRDDMKLMRYNSVSAAVTALSYNQIDAIAVEKPLAVDILNSVSGLRCLEDPIAEETFGFLLPPDHTELKDEINTFIAEFINTPAYEDLVARCNASEGYIFREVPMTGGGRVLHVGAVADAYPFSYPNPETDSIEGSDVEFLCHFANAYGYELVFHSDTHESMEMGILYGEYDVGCGGISDLYRADIELSGCALMSDAFLPVEIVFVVTDGQISQAQNENSDE